MFCCHKFKRSDRQENDEHFFKTFFILGKIILAVIAILNYIENYISNTYFLKSNLFMVQPRVIIIKKKKKTGHLFVAMSKRKYVPTVKTRNNVYIMSK